MDECTECGAPLKPGVKFCGSCGAPTSEAAASAPAEAAPTVAPVPTPTIRSPETQSVADLSAPILTLGDPSAPKPRPAGNNRKFIITGAVVVVIALIVVALTSSIHANQQATALHASQGSHTSNDGTDTNSTDSGTDSQDTNTTDSSGDSTPAPDSSAAGSTIDPSTYAFRSKSGNITCEMSPDGVICHQRLIHYHVPSESCPGGGPGVTVGVDASGASWPCLTAKIKPTTTVPFDHRVDRFGYACLVDLKRGVKCVNPSGSGFTMEYYSGISTF